MTLFEQETPAYEKKRKQHVSESAPSDVSHY